MAVLINGTNSSVKFSEGSAERTVLYAMKLVTTADTIDLASEFKTIKQTSWAGATVIGVAPGSFSGTVATAPAGLSADAAWLLVSGVSQ